METQRIQMVVVRLVRLKLIFYALVFLQFVWLDVLTMQIILAKAVLMKTLLVGTDVTQAVKLSQDINALTKVVINPVEMVLWEDQSIAMMWILLMGTDVVQIVRSRMDTIVKESLQLVMKKSIQAIIGEKLSVMCILESREYLCFFQYQTHSCCSQSSTCYKWSLWFIFSKLTSTSILKISLKKFRTIVWVFNFWKKFFVCLFLMKMWPIQNTKLITNEWVILGLIKLLCF